MKRIEVLVGDELAGHITLETRPNHGFESTTFEYAGTWLAEGFSLSPDLPLSAGPHFPSDGLNVFRAFTDAAPDAWGRRVLFASGALADHLSSNSEIAMLLAVDDVTRQGALRFRLDGQFLTTGQGAAGSPPCRAGCSVSATRGRSSSPDASTGTARSGSPT